MQILRTAPAVEEHFFVEPASAQRGLRLELIVPGDGPPPAGFSPLGESGWKVTAVPAWGRTLSGLVYQPAASSLYPTLIAHAGGPGESFAEFAKNYRKAWDEGCKTVDSPQVRAKSEELAQGATDAVDKARRLGNFVQQAVRYDDSNENGALAWIPIEPGETLRSMKADCKGKVMLMQAMLRAQGIESAPVVLRAEERYFSWGKIPPTTYFNHVILAVHLPADAGPIPATLTEGPVKGWVLFDPVLQTAAFGAPLPGYEGVPALYIGAAPDPVFVIRTSDPSEEKVSIVARVSVDQGGTERVDLQLTDNGRCGLIRRLARIFSQDDIKKQIRETLSEQVTQAVLVDHKLTRAGDSGGDVMRLALTFDAPKSLQEMATTTVCPNPLALPVMLAGIPNGFRPRTPTREEDRIELAPPWDAKRNTNGRAYRVEVAVSLALPPGWSWTPPAPRAENQPWLAYEQKWTEESGVWKGTLRLAVPRGDWPAADRQARLKLLDELFSGLYGPLVLKKS